jgi:hypothetical protein
MASASPSPAELRRIAHERDAEYANQDSKLSIPPHITNPLFTDRYPSSEWDNLLFALNDRNGGKTLSPEDQDSWLDFYCHVYDSPDAERFEESNKGFQDFLYDNGRFKITFVLNTGYLLVVRKWGVRKNPIVSLTCWKINGPGFDLATYNTRMIRNIMDKDLELIHEIIERRGTDSVTQIETSPYMKIYEYIMKLKKSRALNIRPYRENPRRVSTKKAFRSNSRGKDPRSSSRGHNDRFDARPRRSSVNNPALDLSDSAKSPFKSRPGSNGPPAWIASASSAPSQSPSSQSPPSQSPAVSQLFDLVLALEGLLATYSESREIPAKSIEELVAKYRGAKP